MNVMEILDPTGHVELTWTPGDSVSEERARAEFDRLKAAGFAFFCTPDEDAEEVMGWSTRGRPPGWRASGAIDVRTDQVAEDVTVARTEEFKPRARRTVAVRRMQGG